MKTISLTLSILVSTSLFSQKFNWVKTVNTSSNQQVESLMSDRNGNYYASGEFFGNVDFDFGSGSAFLDNSFGSYFLAKYDSSANLIWAIPTQYVEAIAIGPDGDLVYVGTFTGTRDFDPRTSTSNLTSQGYNDVHVVKIKNDGSFLWSKSFGGVDNENVRDVAIDEKGNILITGSFDSLVDFDPSGTVRSITSQGGFNAYILKLDKNGNYIWAKSIPTPVWSHGQSICSDQSGNVLTSGISSGSTDFDPGAGVKQENGSFRLFVQRLDSNGNYLNHMTLSGYSRSSLIQANAQGKIYIAPVGRSTNDPIIMKLDSSLSIEWQKTLQHPMGQGYAEDLVSTSNGTLYTVGSFSGTLDFDPSSGTSIKTTNGYRDIFVLKLSPSGNYIWDQTFGGSDWDEAFGVCLVNEKPLIGGYYQDTTDFNPGSNNHILVAQGKDMFLLNIGGQCTSTTGSISPTACGSYESPSKRYNWISTGTYMDTIANSNGCDSILTINLTVNSIDTSVTSTDTTLSANAGGAAYNWVDCSDFSSQASTQNFKPSASGNYALIISQNGCTDTSRCFNITVQTDPGDTSTTGINAHTPSDIKVYPNPVRNGRLHILNSSVENGRVLILNSTGQVVLSQELKKGDSTIPIDLVNGTYILQVNSNNEVKFQQQIICTD